MNRWYPLGTALAVPPDAAGLLAGADAATDGVAAAEAGAEVGAEAGTDDLAGTLGDGRAVGWPDVPETSQVTAAVIAAIPMTAISAAHSPRARRDPRRRTGDGTGGPGAA
ncbi:MAG: hypothetical protein WAK82_16690, partial [Streptosporangiaceae bacterium]